MANKIPNVINDATIYFDGEDFLGKANVKLPDVETKMTDFMSHGINGIMGIPVKGHTEKLEGSIEFTSPTKDAYGIILNPAQAPLLDMRASIQLYNHDNGAMQSYPIKVTMRAFFYKAGYPEFKQASDTAFEATYEAYYLKVEIDGQEVLEIDKPNYIQKVDGVDILDDVRRDLGK